MDITVELLDDIGFEKVEGSSNPTYYTLKIKCVPLLWIGIIEKTEEWWLNEEGEDSCSATYILKTLQNLISSISEHACYHGKRLQAKKIRKLLEID